MSRKAVPEWDRFWPKVDASGDCWEWTAGRHTNGYALFRSANSNLAHRWVWTTLVGPIPEGLNIDHLCRNRICVNPDHLEVVEPAVNTMRGTGLMAMNARKTHCKRGHEFIQANIRPTAKGGRSCLTCAREKGAAIQERRRDRLIAFETRPISDCPYCGRSFVVVNLHISIKHKGAPWLTN